MTRQAKSRGKQVLLIGLDAATPSLIEQWTDDGTLPNLRQLRDRGAYGRLASTADLLTSSVWPSFLTGLPPGEHGAYHYIQWRPQQMRMRRWNPEWIDLTPFWRPLSEAGPRVIALDVPCAEPPSRLNGIEISNWAALPQVYAPYVYPAPLKHWLAQRFGRSLRRMSRRLSDEMYVPQSLDRLMALTDLYVDATRRMADVAVALMESESWNLFISVLSGAHRGGHELWDSSGVSDGDGPLVERKLREALRRTYVACDEAVRRHVEAAGDDATVLVFTLHGMSANTSRSDLLDPMLRRIISGKPGPARPATPGALKRLRQRVPHGVRLAVKSRLPFSLQDRLSVFWRMGRRDWSGTQAFPVTADVNGYIQINLRGREARGIVQPGAEFDALCRRIAEGLKTFVDADTNEPIVESVTLTDEYFAHASRRADLPDLVVRWASSPAARHRRVVSPQFGAIDWPAPGKMPNGRSGNHVPDAFLLAAGNGIAPGSSIAGGHILDLPPTVYALFELPPPPHLAGRAIPGVTHPDSRTP